MNLDQAIMLMDTGIDKKINLAFHDAVKDIYNMVYNCNKNKVKYCGNWRKYFADCVQGDSMQVDHALRKIINDPKRDADVPVVVLTDLALYNDESKYLVGKIDMEKNVMVFSYHQFLKGNGSFKSVIGRYLWTFLGMPHA
jgi:predicted Zn-dependent protease